MAGTTLNIDISDRGSSYEIVIANGSISQIGSWAKKRTGKTARKIMVVSNTTVFPIYGEFVVDQLRSAGFEVGTGLLKDGEVHKNWRNVEKAMDAFAAFDLSRTDVVIALGGGVVGDLAGFAASIYIRGISFLQVPTTLLSMIDSSVGGKTGVNSSAGKNRVGSFYQPTGVLIDTGLLRTLPAREITAGLCEALKQSVLSGRELFKLTSDFLATYPTAGMLKNFGEREFGNAIDNLIAAQVGFKASIVRGDERESTGRADARSRKILNFGHTLAHALEKVTSYKYFKHGEAVGYGILYAAELSKMLALTNDKVVNLLYDVVHRAGVLPTLSNIDPEEVVEAFRFDKKLVAGSLQMILIRGIGKPVIVNGDSIPRSTHIKALKSLLKNY
jgi:3-dehydroquinate synthase